MLIFLAKVFVCLKSFVFTLKMFTSDFHGSNQVRSLMWFVFCLFMPGAVAGQSGPESNAFPTVPTASHYQGKKFVTPNNKTTISIEEKTNSKSNTSR